MTLTPYFLLPTGNQEVLNATINDGMAFSTSVILDDVASMRVIAGRNLRYDFTTPDDELWYHFFVRFGGTYFLSGPQNGYFIKIGKNPNILMELRLNIVSRKIEAYVGASLVATGSAVIAADTSYHFQLRYKIHDSTGAIQLKIDTEAASFDINFSGDTKPGSETDFDQLILANGFAAGSSDVYFSSIYVDSAAFQGILHMKKYTANRDGNYTSWSKSTGSVGYVLVDETPPSGSDYLFSQTAAQKQSVGFQPFDGPSNSVILGVVHAHVLKKVSTGAAKISGRSNSSESTPTTLTLGTDFKTSYHIMTVDPNTSAAFTVARLQDQTSAGVEAIIEMV